MRKIMRPRSLLPIQFTFGALIFGLAAARSALANADQLNLQPSRIECRLGNGHGIGIKRTDIYYDGLRIHDGREIEEAEANGDYVKCRSVVDRATSLGREVIMLRGYVGQDEVDWDSDGFFTVAGDSCR